MNGSYIFSAMLNLAFTGLDVLFSNTRERSSCELDNGFDRSECNLQVLQEPLNGDCTAGVKFPNWHRQIIRAELVL